MPLSQNSRISQPSSHRCTHPNQYSFHLSQQDYPHSFIRGSMGWSCRHCSHLPFHLRAPNSFYSSINPPPISYIQYHQQVCNGASFYSPPQTQLNRRTASMNFDNALNYLNSTSDQDSSLVLKEDRILLSNYFYHMIKQLQACKLTESDRKTRGGKRDNVKLGYGGLECRHCAMKNPSFSRKFFWSSVDRLANSFAEVSSAVI